MPNLGFITKNKQIFTRFVLQLLFIMFVVEFVKGALLISILPVYMKSELGLSAFAIGLSLALQYIGDNLFRSPIGWVIDRIGYRTSMLAGVTLAFIAVSLFALTSSLIWIIVASVILGVGTSPLWPCVITATTEVAGDNAKGTIMSVVYMAWLTGVGMGPVVINFFIKESYGLAFRILIVMMVLVIIAALFLPSHKKRVEIHTRVSRHAPKSHENLLKRIQQYFSEINKSLNVSILFFLGMFAQTFALGILTPVLTIYARSVLHLSASQYSYFLIAGGAFTVILLIPMGKLVDKWGPKWFLHAGFLIGSITMLIFTYIHSLPLLYAFVALLGGAYALIIPAWNALIASVIPKEKRGAIWGFFLTIEGSGMIVGPIVSGKLWDLYGPHAPFLTSGAVLLILFVLHHIISHNTKVKKHLRRGIL